VSVYIDTYVYTPLRCSSDSLMVFRSVSPP
jgi:hypothetical protein